MYMHKPALPPECGKTEPRIRSPSASFDDAAISIKEDGVKKEASQAEILSNPTMAQYINASQKYKTLLLTNDNDLAGVHVTFNRNDMLLNKPDDVNCKTNPDANNRENTSALNASPLSSSDVRFFRQPLSATQAQIHSECSTAASPDDDALDESAGIQLLNLETTISLH